MLCAGDDVVGNAARNPCYFSEDVNFAHASVGTLSVNPLRSVVSLTRITLFPLAVSTQDPLDPL